MTTLKTMFENYADGGTDINIDFNTNQISNTSKRSELNYIVDVKN